MARSDWYTRSTWTPEDAEAFWARLRRTRDPLNAAQYVRIQAETLEKNGLVDQASVLLEHILAEYPGAFDLAQVHYQLATCRERQGRTDEALAQLRAALAVEAQRPNYQTRAWLTFGRLAVEQGRPELYPEFLADMASKASGKGGLESLIVFPVDRYILSSVLAVIARESGDLERAQSYAKDALAAAEMQHSGFRYHPRLGLVSETDTPLYKQVSSIAGLG